MKPIAIAAAALGIAALGSWSSPANAATCFREIVAGPSGHREMVRGCYTRERIATRAPRRTVTTKTVTTDYYTTSRPYTSTVTREYYPEPVTRSFYSEPVARSFYSEPATRTFDEEIYSGSSMPGPRPYWWGGY
jgi:hypothetical protein